ncbi:DUF402 domain-containing protein [Sporosarcina sp. ACRSL]|uniref:DUF402 domain-containing protein n=1 Tax=Sporosarcina sp. ACRSL TaxID=2918215 RepID=UPI001EF6001E|nr:DUF402 domain-containing protein [Sporosarcina sp. ACRSL]MCG7342624.1 DUF402 domain-containing protein [Sporosarcina sp. ACRSL]
MLKRKYGSRYDWKRIVKRRNAEKYISSTQFKGYVTMLQMDDVSEALYMTYNGRSVCIADKGYSWLQHFPDEKHFSVTTVFDSSNHIVQWYIDICRENGYCHTNGPWMDDLFLDLIVLPTGEVIEKDLDEIEVAHHTQLITDDEFALAWSEFNRIKMRLANNSFDLLTLTKQHLQMLKEDLGVLEHD